MTTEVSTEVSTVPQAARAAISAAARALAAAPRPPRPRVCATCGRAYESSGPRSRYCSAACRLRAFRARRRDAARSA